MATAKKATAKKATAKKSTARKISAKKAPAKKTAVKKTAVKKTAAKKTAAKKAPAKKAPAKKASSKRTLIAPRGDKRLIRRNAKGQIVESDDLSRSLSADVRRHAKTVAAPGQGDRGDQKPRKSAQKT